MASLRVTRAREAFLALNRSFQAQTLLPDGVYRRLEEQGVVVSNAILIDAFPDGGGTFCGRLVHRRRVYAFDVDTSDRAATTWEDVTESFLERCGALRHRAPWSPEILAYETAWHDGKDDRDL